MIDLPYAGRGYHSQAKHFKNIELMALDILPKESGRAEQNFKILMKAENEAVVLLLEKSRALIE